MTATGFLADNVELISPLQREKCIHRLRERIDPPWTFFGNRPLIGRIDGYHLLVRKRIGYGYQGSFLTHLAAEFEQEVDQTRIRCRFSMHPALEIFITVWLSMLLLIGGGLSIGVLAAHAMPIHERAAIVLKLMGIIACAFGLLRFSRYLAWGEQAFMLGILQDTLSARVISG